jgi:hypothetical protein
MAEQSTAERAGWVVISALCFGVGALFGARACGGDEAAAGAEDVVLTRDGSGVAPRCEPQIVERLVESAPRVIYECPPEPEPPKPTGSGVAKKATPKPAKPDAEPDLDPRERQKLLAWVRDQSDDLKVCRDDRKDIYRLAVWMHLKAGSDEVARVDLNAADGELPAPVAQCLRKRILRWRPPRDLVRKHDTLVFGLTI